MIICNSREYVYIHLHKCAGTSVERALARSLHYNDILIGSTERGEDLQPLFQQMLGLHKHSPAAAVRRVLGENAWGRYFTFATVRHPFDLAISQYRFSLMLLRKAAQGAGVEGRPVSEFAGLHTTPSDWRWSYPGVRALLSAAGMETSFSAFIRSPQLENWGGFAPMTDHLSDDAGGLLVDATFKVEELNTSWPILLKQLGIETSIVLDTCNATKTVPASAAAGVGRSRKAHYRSEEDAQLIRQRFRRDFETFGYAQEIFA